jgi:TadE-like protein
MGWRRRALGLGGERGSAVVEFALVAPLAVAIALAVSQFALFLFERNVVMGSLSEGARVAASSGRTLTDGERAARRLIGESLGGRLAAAVRVRGDVEGGIVALRAEGTLPSIVPGVPGLRVHLGATMHKEEELAGLDPEGDVAVRNPAAVEPPRGSVRE